tara:strand:- start:197 stop:718 length:522 start_codon:yes stop_codon:yes gene_type:complete
VNIGHGGKKSAPYWMHQYLPLENCPHGTITNNQCPQGGRRPRFLLSGPLDSLSSGRFARFFQYPEGVDMNFVKLLGISVLILGLAACGGSDNGTSEEQAAAEAEAALSPEEKAAAEAKAKEEELKAIEEARIANEEARKKAAEEAVPLPKEKILPEGMVEGSVEHSIWLNNQQ